MHPAQKEKENVVKNKAKEMIIAFIRISFN